MFCIFFCTKICFFYVSGNNLLQKICIIIKKNQYINIVTFFHAKSSCKDDVYIVPDIHLTDKNPPYSPLQGGKNPKSIH